MQKVIICLLGALCTARGQQFCTASCTDDVWNAIAVRPTESATCGDRIEWMMSSGGGSLTELDACQFIAEENPICAPCAPNPIPPPAPTPYSTKLDVASYSDTPAPGGRVDVAGCERRGSSTPRPRESVVATLRPQGSLPTQTYRCGTM
mmetsp:Transcript_23981/g.72076  ORF Transcript_23981/g.72076 Transcript_23981/m.72076 type:complete len:149 (+) Transcript_23981:138-584(+)